MSSTRCLASVCSAAQGHSLALVKHKVSGLGLLCSARTLPGPYAAQGVWPRSALQRKDTPWPMSSTRCLASFCSAAQGHSLALASTRCLASLCSAAQGHSLALVKHKVSGLGLLCSARTLPGPYAAQGVWPRSALQRKDTPWPMSSTRCLASLCSAAQGHSLAHVKHKVSGLALLCSARTLPGPCQAQGVWPRSALQRKDTPWPLSSTRCLASLCSAAQGHSLALVKHKVSGLGLLCSARTLPGPYAAQGVWPRSALQRKDTPWPMSSTRCLASLCSAAQGHSLAHVKHKVSGLALLCSARTLPGPCQAQGVWPRSALQRKDTPWPMSSTRCLASVCSAAQGHSLALVKHKVSGLGLLCSARTLPGPYAAQGVWPRSALQRKDTPWPMSSTRCLASFCSAAQGHSLALVKHKVSGLALLCSARTLPGPCQAQGVWPRSALQRKDTPWPICSTRCLASLCSAAQGHSLAHVKHKVSGLALLCSARTLPGPCQAQGVWPRSALQRKDTPWPLSSTRCLASLCSAAQGHSLAHVKHKVSGLALLCSARTLPGPYAAQGVWPRSALQRKDTPWPMSSTRCLASLCSARTLPGPCQAQGVWPRSALQRKDTPWPMSSTRCLASLCSAAQGHSLAHVKHKESGLALLCSARTLPGPCQAQSVWPRSALQRKDTPWPMSSTRCLASLCSAAQGHSLALIKHKVSGLALLCSARTLPGPCQAQGVWPRSALQRTYKWMAQMDGSDTPQDSGSLLQ
ncbi:hypothetical protein NDU88_001485 [Pleurodeles waltl]|uniref:Uncharacterized protein n=1 Tax=Pleurodeles waltl TaxID=8319 RepID=A0AAV7MJV6_PLEWA|nr:hypothetical protein NDU88_001485 [Pleurodeles waltl]